PCLACPSRLATRSALAPPPLPLSRRWGAAAASAALPPSRRAAGRSQRRYMYAFTPLRRTRVSILAARARSAAPVAAAVSRGVRPDTRSGPWELQRRHADDAAAAHVFLRRRRARYRQQRPARG